MLLALALVLAMGIGTTASAGSLADQGTIHMTIGTASIGGTNYPVGVALGKIWTNYIEDADIRAVAIATGGSPNNIELLRTNDIDAAVCRQIEANRARAGEDPYGEEMPWLVAITGGLFKDATQIVARTDAGIETIDDFRGKRIAVGAVGSGGEVDARETLAAYGLTYNDITAEYIEASQAIEMLEDGLIDGAVLGLAVGSASVQELMLTGKIRMLDISDEALENLQKVSPYLVRYDMAANIYPNQDYPVATVGSPADVIVARSDMSDEMAYELTKAVYDNAEEMIAVSSILSQFGPEMVLEEDEMLLPYHPGTKQYFVEQGWIEG